MELTAVGELWEWRGPAPYFFVTVPAAQSDELHAVARAVSYGWGMVAVRATVGSTTWSTSLFRKDGRYVLPVKDAVRTAERLREGDVVEARLVLTLGA